MSGVDVLIVSALKEEYEAARDSVPAENVGGGGKTAWKERDRTTSTPYLVTKLVDADGTDMTVALARPTRMGGPTTSSIASTLVERLKPRCIAMSGVCAGNPSDLALGDVIIAEMVYAYDEGKRTRDGFEGDHRQIPMLDSWVRAAQELVPDGLPSFCTASDSDAKNWLLERLHAGEDPKRHPARPRYIPARTWPKFLQRLTARSSTLAAKWGSLESLKLRTWWGRRPCVRQIRWTDLTLSPLAAAIAGTVQCVTPSGGGSPNVRVTTVSTRALGNGGIRDGRSCRAADRRRPRP